MSHCVLLCCFWELTRAGPAPLQASAEDHRHGAGPVPAHLWDGGELPVPGRRQRGDANAAELPQLRPAAACLHDDADPPERWVKPDLHLVPLGI